MDKTEELIGKALAIMAVLDDGYASMEMIVKSCVLHKSGGMEAGYSVSFRNGVSTVLRGTGASVPAALEDLIASSRESLDAEQAKLSARAAAIAAAGG